MTDRIAILYATREGQTEKIAEFFAWALRARGIETDVHDVRDLDDDWALAPYATAILAASLHAGRYEREMVEFARDHRDALVSLRAAFVPVTLSEAGAEDTERAPDVRARFAEEVAATVRAFEAATLWQPSRVIPVAGALAYTKYNPVVRFLMKRVAKKVGASTDTSRDHEYTDWAALDRVAGEIADSVAIAPGTES